MDGCNAPELGNTIHLRYYLLLPWEKQLAVVPFIPTQLATTRKLRKTKQLKPTLTYQSRKKEV